MYQNNNAQASLLSTYTYSCLFFLVSLIYIDVQIGEIKTFALVSIGICLLLLCKQFSIPVSVRRVHTVYFTVFFVWISENRYYDFFENLPYAHIIFILITLAEAYCISKSGLKYDLTFSRNKWNVVFRFLTIVILNFMLFGFQTLQVGRLSGMPAQILLFIALFWWSGEFYKLVVRIFLKARNGRYRIRDDKTNVKVKPKVVWMITFAILAFCGIIFSIPYYPGIVSPDSFSNFISALEFDNIGYRSDLHSFAFILLTKMILTICDHYYAVTLFMILSFSAVWASVMMWLFKEGVDHKLLIVVSVLWMLNPINGYMIFCTWKDIPFTICMLMLSFAIMQIVRKKEPSLKTDILLTLSLFGTAVFRSNGQVAAAGLVLVFAVLMIRRKISARHFIAVLISGLMILGFKGPVFKVMQVQPSLEGFASVPFIDGIWENVHAGNYINGEVLNFINEELMPVEEFKDSYAENYTNIYAFKNGYANINLKRAQRCYWWCLKRYPTTTLLARFKRTYNIWSVFPSGTYNVERNYYARLRNWGEEGSQYEYLSYSPALENLRLRFHQWYSEDYLTGTVFFFVERCGLNLAIWLIIGIELLRIKRGILWLPIVPAFLNVLGLFIGCCFPDVRYFYPMFVLSVPFYLMICSTKEIDKELYLNNGN